MEVIEINGKMYDPYFILGVTKDDSSEHITKSFRKRVKKYHPDKYTDKKDKKKYELYFKILVASFEYIKERRMGRKSIHLIDKAKYRHEVDPKSCDLDSFNKEFDNTQRDPNDHGYGENYTRLEKVEEYENLKVELVNLFGKKKFSNKQFNKIFEWNKYKNSENDQSEMSKQLIHKTTDGFSSYNSGLIDNNCSLVSSYNGLMIAGDDLGERGVGYWGNNYSDYSMVHKGVRNPVKKPKIPRKFSIDAYIENSKSDQNESKVYTEDKYALDKKQYNDLLEKERLDKEIVLKYINKYQKEIAEKALNDELEKSQSLKDILQGYISYSNF